MKGNGAGTGTPSDVVAKEDAVFDLLVVDDEEDQRELIRKFLRDLDDLRIHEAASFGEAMDILGRENVSMVLLDINLPDKSGLELLKHLKEERPSTEVVMVSGDVNTDYTLESLRLHAYDYLVKPLRKKKVLACIRNLKHTLHLRRENERMNRLLKRMNERLEEEVRRKTEELTERVRELDILYGTYKTLLRNIPSGCLIIDGRDHIYECNEKACTILELDTHPEKAKGRAVAANPRLKPLCELLNGPLPLEGVRVKLPYENDDSYTSLRLSAERIDTNGGERFTIVVVEDVTTMEAMERELRRKESLATIGALASGIVHELKNPLGAIRGIGELITIRLESLAQLKTFSENIMNEVDRLSRILSDIAGFSRLSPPVRTELDLNDLLRHVASDSGAQDTIRLKLEEPPSGVRIMCDYTQMKQALRNIVDNALRATSDKGEVTLATSYGPRHATVIVTDTGVGIPEEYLDKVFKPFFSTRKESGSGLGLTIARKIVSDHGGTITIESTEGKGTSVIVTLPYEQSTRTREGGGGHEIQRKEES